MTAFLRLLVCVVLLATMACSDGVADPTAAQAKFEENVRCLRETARSFEASPEGNEAIAQRYFDCFPSDFVTLMKVFGGEGEGDDARYAPLYEVAHEHLLGMLPKTAAVVGSDRWYDKLIGIAIGGEWQADAPSYLQELLRHGLISEREAILTALDRRTDTDIQSFWRFYDDGPHGPRGEPSPCHQGDRWRSCSLFSSRF